MPSECIQTLLSSSPSPFWPVCIHDGYRVEKCLYGLTDSLLLLFSLSPSFRRHDGYRILCCHHDTKCTTGHPQKEHNFHFVGANDGASGVALLLALAPVLKATEREATIDLVFFDGEESLDWNWNEAARALFGSKRFVAQLQAEALQPDASRVRAMVLLDNSL